MVDHVFPEDEGTGAADGDFLDAANLASQAFHQIIADYVIAGLNVTTDGSVIDVSAGMCSISDDSASMTQVAESRDNGVLYNVIADPRTDVALPDTGGVNYVFLTINLTSDDSVSIDVNTTGNTPSNTSLQIAEVDAATASVTEVNREYDLSGVELSDGDTTIWDPVNEYVPEASVEQGSGSGLDADSVDGVEASELGSDVSNNGTTVTSSSTDLDFGENLVAADDGDGTSSISLDLTRFIGEDELPAGDTLQIDSDEYMVVGGSYTLNGDATIDGDLVIVSNQTSHDNLVDVDPTDHLEVIKEYQITASSGLTPAFDGTLSNALAEELTAFDVTVAPTNGLNDTYAFNYDDGKRWNNGSWDVPLTINWDEDPGSDLDLTVRIHKRT